MSVMTINIDEKHILLISSHLSQFKKAEQNYRCRCPLCGDSKKSKIKSRGYFLRGDEGFSFFCQNCGASMALSQFIENVAPEMLSEYKFEKFKANNSNDWSKPVSKPAPKKTIQTVARTTSDYQCKNLISVKNLPDGHKCKEYVKRRMIPERFWEKLFYTDNYMKWINENVKADKFDKKRVPVLDQRLVIPFYDSSLTPYGYQGRALVDGEHVLRYITIHEKTDEDVLLYGLDVIDTNKTLYVLEGPIDSMFINNALAAAGSSLMKLLKYEGLDDVYVFDNQNRSPEIIALMEKVIALNKKVVIFPKHIIWKDINDMIEKGHMKQQEVMSLLEDNTYKGLKANLKFTEWKEI